MFSRKFFKKKLILTFFFMDCMNSFNAEIQELIKKLEHYCAYQERCHEDVRQKMHQLNVPYRQRDELVVHLIENNYLNEERFAIAFARGKHRIKLWGKQRISNELKLRNISSRIINTAIKELSDQEYYDNFTCLAEKIWQQTTESNLLLKKKKCTEFLLRKGYETSLVYDKIHELESTL